MAALAMCARNAPMACAVPPSLCPTVHELMLLFITELGPNLLVSETHTLHLYQLLTPGRL